MCETVPLLRKVVLREDGRNRTDRHACAAIDAFDGVDIQQLLTVKTRVVLFRVNAIHRARVDASRVFGTNAGFGDNVCHGFKLPHGLWKPNISQAKGGFLRLTGVTALQTVTPSASRV